MKGSPVVLFFIVVRLRMVRIVKVGIGIKTNKEPDTYNGNHKTNKDIPDKIRNHSLLHRKYKYRISQQKQQAAYCYSQKQIGFLVGNNKPAFFLCIRHTHILLLIILLYIDIIAFSIRNCKKNLPKKHEFYVFCFFIQQSKADIPFFKIR